MYPINTFIDDAAARMGVVDEPDTILRLMSEVERVAFYERAKAGYAVIQTGERRFYGRFALRKGVIGPEVS